jgi:hypothetical protein
MIQCPKCGKPNQDNSPDCIWCGAVLKSAASGGKRCPMCGKVNPPSNVTCESCGTRLVLLGSAPAPSAAPPPRQEAARPAPQAPGLAPKPAAPSPQAPGPAPRPAAPAPQAPEPAPSSSDDWLNRLRGTMPQEPAPDEDIPDWLRAPAPAPVEPESPAFDLAARLGGSSVAQPDVPDWLQQLAPTESQVPAAPAPASGQAETPDWLRQLAPEPHAAQQPAPSEVPDWLRQLASVEPPAPASSQAEIPDWMQQPAQAEPQTFAEPTLAAGEAEAPDWLKRLGPAAPETFAEPASAAGEADVPDWLKGPGPTAPVPVEPTSELPDWMQQLVPAEPVAFAEPAPATGEAEMPDWLRGLAPTGRTPVEPSSELPDWMQQFPPTEPAPAGPAFVGEPVSESAETPAWLAEIAQAPSEPAVPAQAPEWLQELEQPSGAEAAPGAEAPEAPVAVPDWLKELKPSEETPAQAVFTGMPARAEAAAAGGLVAAQIPSWLQQLAPKGVLPEAQEKAEPAETEGLLSGVQGALQIVDAIRQVSATGPLHPEISASDLAHAGALQELLTRGATSVVVRREGESRGQKLWHSTQRLLVFLVLAVLVIVPLWQEQLVVDLGLVSKPALTPMGSGVAQKINALEPGARVLVAFDYDATQSPEMDRLAEAVFSHLLARKAQVQVISLYPSGPAVAQTVINRVEISRTSGITIENRGYVPGQNMGVVSMQEQAKQAALVIELAASPDTLRWWAEQIGTGPAPLVAAVSAAAEPMSLPYVYSQQVKGMLVGVRDAAAYRLQLPQEARGHDSEAHILAPLGAVAMANVALVVLMVLGGLAQLVSRGVGGKRK